MAVAAAAAAFGAWAETETVGDYTWTYSIDGDTAEIAGVLPEPTGAVTIPSTLGGKGYGAATVKKRGGVPITVE